MNTKLVDHSPSAAAADSAPIQMRIDPPHALPGSAAPAAAITAAATPGDAVDPQPSPPVDETVEFLLLLRTQAHQLAAALRHRQQELDQRESHLNVQAEQLDQETRQARLWWQEQLAELARQTEELSRREEAATQCPIATTAQTEQATQASPALGDRMLADQLEALRRAETLLAAELAEARRAHEQLLASTAAHRQWVEAEVGELDQRRQRDEEELADKRCSLAHEAERIESRRAELHELRNELREAQRETLEVRRAAEELWTQLSGQVPAAAVTEEIGRIRQRLADQYRLASADIEDQKRELETLRSRLQQQHDHLATRHGELHGWFERRQEELNQQAEDLAGRERELAAERVNLAAAQQRVLEDRGRFHQELREILARVR